MSRADIAEKDRKPFYLYVDEFQNYSTEAFATAFSEGRKFKLAITTANQYLGQLDEASLHALFGNVGSLVTFQIGATDSEFLVRQVNTEAGEGAVTPQDLQNLPKYRALARLLIGGEPSRPFSMTTIAPPAAAPTPRNIAAIRNRSRNRHARPIGKVTREIEKALAGI
jgi:hypothetical protein